MKILKIMLTGIAVVALALCLISAFDEDDFLDEDLYF